MGCVWFVSSTSLGEFFVGGRAVFAQEIKHLFRVATDFEDLLHVPAQILVVGDGVLAHVPDFRGCFDPGGSERDGLRVREFHKRVLLPCLFAHGDVEAGGLGKTAHLHDQVAGGGLVADFAELSQNDHRLFDDGNLFAIDGGSRNLGGSATFVSVLSSAFLVGFGNIFNRIMKGLVPCSIL